MLNSSSGAVVVTEQGSAIKTRGANVWRNFESERWECGSDNRAVPFDIQVGMERPGEMVAPRSRRGSAGEQSGKDLPSQSRH